MPSFNLAHLPGFDRRHDFNAELVRKFAATAPACLALGYQLAPRRSQLRCPPQ